VGGLFGFDAQMILQVGETASTITIEGDQGRNTILPLGFAIRCRDFRIEQYPNSNRPKQYYSELEVLEHGKTIKEETIYVNHPLGFHGINFYQSSYGDNPMLAFTLQSKNKKHPLSTYLREKTVVEAFDFTLIPVRYIDANEVREHGGMKPGVLAHVFYNHQMMPPDWIFQDEPKVFQTAKGPLTLSFNGMTPNYYTVLQVSKNPGIHIILAGFVILCLGLSLLSLYTFGRHYLIIDKKSRTFQVIFLKDKFLFSLEPSFKKLVEELKQEDA
jgi:cytochrome c biogenesis protein